MRTRRASLGLLATASLALGTALGPLSALAQPTAPSSFPSRPLKFIVPFGPGSGTDTSARYFARKLQEATGQAVIVENKPGANGFLAVKQLLAAPADGYTVFIGSNSTLAVNVALFKQLPYDPLTDLAPLNLLMRSPAMLVVPANAPHKTLKDFLAHAREQPGKLSFGAGSAGYQLMGEALNDAARVQTLHVPFKGAGEVATAVAGGVVDYAFAEVTAVQELAKAGRVRALAVASAQRVPNLPEVPTASEAGLPGFEAYTWVAAMVNARTPAAETARLAELFTAISRLPETREFYDRLGATAMTGGPEQLRHFQQAEVALWRRIAQQARVEQQ